MAVSPEHLSHSAENTLLQSQKIQEYKHSKESYSGENPGVNSHEQYSKEHNGYGEQQVVDSHEPYSKEHAGSGETIKVSSQEHYSAEHAGYKEEMKLILPANSKDHYSHKQQAENAKEHYSSRSSEHAGTAGVGDASADSSKGGAGWGDRSSKVRTDFFCSPFFVMHFSITIVLDYAF